MRKCFTYTTVLLILFVASLSAQPPNNFMGGAEFKDNDPRLPKEGDLGEKTEIAPELSKKKIPVLPKAEEGINLSDSKTVTSPTGEDQSDYIPLLPADEGTTAKKNYPLDNSFDNLVSVPIKENDLSLLEDLNELKKKVSDLESLMAAKNSKKPVEEIQPENPVDLKMLEDLRKKVEKLEKQREEDAKKTSVTRRPTEPNNRNNLPKKEEIVKNGPVIKEHKPETPEFTKSDSVSKAPTEKEDIPVKTSNDSVEDSTPRQVYYLEKGDFRPAGKKGASLYIPDVPKGDQEKKDSISEIPTKDIQSEKKDSSPIPQETFSPVVDKPKKNTGPEWKEWDKTVLRDGGNVYANLSPGYYVQVGAYSLKTSTAQSTVKKLKSKNIVAPVKILKGLDYRRVLVGTLRKDEVGQILAKLESVGYKKTLLIWVK